MKIIYGIFGLIVLLAYSHAESNEFGYNIAQRDIKYENNTAELTCFVSKTILPVIWNKIDIHGLNEPIKIAEGKTLIIDDSRFSIKIHSTGLLITLKIKDINVTDAGFYQCEVVPAYGRPLSAVKELQVPHPATIFDVTIRSLIIKEGEEIIIECYANGHPTPKISWKRENNKLLPISRLSYSDNVLNIKNATKEDRGLYYCIAENGIGSPDKHNIGIDVEFSPIIIAPIIRYWKNLRSDVNISCNIEAFPLPVIVWLKDGIQILNNKHYKIIQVATVNKMISTTIQITNIRKRHFGNYICQAFNEFGTANSTIYLNESKTPQNPIISKPKEE